jgi:phosphate transport system permease protein
MQTSPLYAGRKLRNGVVMSLCTLAAVFGLTWLALILFTLITHGFGGLSADVFTKMTPPPGEQGGLLNPIVGSLLMTTLGILIGAPIGILAGTYMAEYGRNTKLTFIVRFINDILLSAPSIVIGLFVYTICVAPRFKMAIPLPWQPGQTWDIQLGGHFSGFAGAIALAIIVIPVVVRTTEDMLLLVPGQLREAASALGMPRSLVIRNVCYRSAKAGIITGVLLAVARISGETAPLLFTALNNQFWNVKLTQPMASLPAVIFQFALSPYKDWQKLAWVGALLITFAVLGLSIGARALSAQKGATA